MSRGRGVHMVRSVQDVPRNKVVLIQRYIKNPLILSNGKKFDIRIYVFVTSMDPLKVYMYDDGIVRFATREYNSDPRSLKQKDVHLTNYSINVKKKNFVEPGDEDEDCGGLGSKWTLNALRKHIMQHHRECNFDDVWTKIKDIVVKTMISVESNMNTLIQPNLQHRNVCFELFGFDIVLDDNFRPWLLEVNTSPALQTPTMLDKRVKFPLVANMLELVGVIPYSKTEYKKRQLEARRSRLLGMSTSTSAAAAARQTYTAAMSSHTSTKKRPSTPSGAPKRVDVRAIENMNFSGVKPEDLPDVIKESEAELTRCGRFERVYPPTVAAWANGGVEPDHYDIFFESNRFNNALLVKYEKEKKRRMLRAAAAAKRTMIQTNNQSLKT